VALADFQAEATAHFSEEVMNKHIGSSFESFLDEKGIKADVDLRAQKEILAEQIGEAMDRKGMSFSALASSMGTSRTVVYRLLDPSDTGVTLDTLSRVARALGLGLKISLARVARRGSRASLRKTG
jgi:antitoxin HicB